MKRNKLLMIDNYDSFTYNIVQYFGELGAEVEVFRNDEISVADIAARTPDLLVVSPGPCSPAEAGISVAAIQHFAGKLPILGVCLGHQSDWRGLRRHHHPRPAAHARQDQRDHHHAAGRVRRPARAVHRQPLPLAGDRKIVLPQGPGRHGLDRRW